MIGRRLFLTLLVLLVLATLAVAAKPVVDYDREADQLTVNVEDLSLQLLLAHLQLQTGVEISMDPILERQVTVVIRQQTLQRGLKNMARVLGVNHLLVYSAESTGKDGPLVVGMKVLPSGTSDSARARSVVSPEQEVVYRSRMMDQAETESSQPVAEDLSNVRWQERLDSLPEHKRERLVALAEKLEAKRLEIRERREQKRVEREQRRLEKEEERKKRKAERNAQPQ